MFIFKGAAKRLDDTDLPRIGVTIGVGEDEIHAVLDVETNGSGFDSQGRVKALYEPHIAWKLSSGKVRERLVAAGLAYQVAGSKPYPKDSYPRILVAVEIDEDIALRSTSWGLGQVMGFNAGAAGYSGARAMVEAFADSEAAQLAGMVKFIATNGLDDELRRHDWAGFARGYNGPAYAKNKYDEKLAAAYARWAKIKDTPWAPESAAPSTAPKPAQPIEIAKPNQPESAPPAPASEGLLSRFVSAFLRRLKGAT